MRSKNKPKPTFSQSPLIQQIRGIKERGSSPDHQFLLRTCCSIGSPRLQLSSGQTYMLWHFVFYRLQGGSVLLHGPPGASLGQPASPWLASWVAGESAPLTATPSPSSPILVYVGLFYIFSLLSCSCCAGIFSCFLHKLLHRCYCFCWLAQLWPVEGHSQEQEELDSGGLSQQPSLNLPPTHLLTKQQGFCSVQVSMCLCLQESMIVPDLLFLFPFPYLLYRKQNKIKSHASGKPPGLRRSAICCNHFCSINSKLRSYQKLRKKPNS